VITQNSEHQIINNGAILIDGDVIVDMGPSAKLEKKYAKADKKVIEGRDRVVLPGLINAHTHAAMTLLRGFADDMALGEWLTKKIWPAEAKLKPADIYRGTKLACQEMLRSGTTTFANVYWHPKREIRAIKETGLRGFVGLVAMEEGARSFGPSYIEKTFREVLPEINEKIEIMIAPHSIYAVSEKTLIWCKQFADKNKLLLHIHLAETEGEVENCLKEHGCRPVEYLERIGFLDNNVVAAHVCWVNDREIKILAKRKVSVAHCPTSNLKLVSGIMPFGKMLKNKVNIALGTDGPSSNNNLDMFESMKIAALIHKWNEKNPQAADAQTILDLATFNGARALKMKKEIGSLTIGKKADMVIVNFNKPHLKPCFSPISHLVYSASGADVERVIVGGKVLFKK